MIPISCSKIEPTVYAPYQARLQAGQYTNMKPLRQAGQIMLTCTRVSWYYKDNRQATTGTAGQKTNSTNKETQIMIRALGNIIILGTSAVIFAYALCMWTTQDLGRPTGLTERMARYEQILKD